MPQVLDGKYTLGKSLGEGGFCRVHEATDGAGNKYAVKTWIEFQQKMFEDETRATDISEHPHLVNYISASPKGTLEDTNSGKTSEVAYILMEHVGGGELLESLMDHGGFSEEISRYFFKQLLMGLNKLHLEGLCHRDLKPENILFTADEYDIKITDFGFLLPVEGRDRTAWLKSRVGTLTYMAPEVFNRQKYRGKSIDIYSLGVILFVMHLGSMPMETATESDKFFKALATNRSEVFWRTHQQNTPDQEIPKEFQDLITMMINPDQDIRLDLGDIVAHPWMQGPIASQGEVIEEMERRKERSKEMADEARAGSARQADDGQVFRDFELNGVRYVTAYKNAQEQSDEKVIQLDIKEMEGAEQRLNKLQTSFQPDEVFNQINSYLLKKGVSAMKIVGGEWRLEFEVVKTINLNPPQSKGGDDSDEKDDEEQKQVDPDDLLEEKSVFDLEIVRSDGKTYLTFKKQRGSFQAAREYWTGIQENIKLLE